MQITQKNIPFTFFLIGLLFIIGISLDLIISKEIKAFYYPYNLIFGGIFICAIILSGIFLQNTRIIRWLSGSESAISALGYVLFLLLIVGLFKQETNSNSILYKLGFSHILSSHSFVIAMGFLLTSLGLGIIKRMNRFSFHNVRFIILHAGVWIILFSAGFGKGDVQNLWLSIPANEYSPINQAYTSNGIMKKLDFYILKKPSSKFFIKTENSKSI